MVKYPFNIRVMVTKPCKLLDMKCTTTFILGLGCGNEVCITSMQEYIPNYKSLKDCANVLKNEGLIDMEYVFEPRPSIHVRLTRKGEAVARHLQACADIINGHTKVE